jgi:DNA-directed RNA polymerase specialized sigma subunit
MNGMTLAQEYREQQAKEADERHQDVIELYRRGLKQTEIARDLGITQGRVSHIIVRARKRGLLK